MKLDLKFDTEVDDKTDIQCAINGNAMYSVLWDLDQHLRSKVKYAEDSAHEEYTKAHEEIRDKLRELVYENHLTFIFQ